MSCAGRILAAPVDSPVNVPACDRSAMDGFAVRAADTVGVSETASRSLTVVDTLAAFGDGDLCSLGLGSGWRSR